MLRVVSIATVVAAVLLLGCGGSGDSGAAGSFSEEAFQGINPGDSEEEVVAALGDPVDTDPQWLDGSVEVWSYCEDGDFVFRTYRVWFHTDTETVQKTDEMSAAEAEGNREDFPCD